MSDRRTILARITKILALVGMAFLAVPFLSHFLRGPDEAASPEAELLVDLAGLLPGRVKEVDWRGTPVWIYRRTDADLAAMDRLGRQLRDPASQASEQPAAARNSARSLRPRYFVFIPRETSRNCQVRLLEPGELEVPALQGALFVEPCYRAHFDSAGRIFRNTGNDQQRNLRVPPHRFNDETTLGLLHGANANPRTRH